MSADIKKILTELKVDINKRFDDLNERFDKLDEKLSESAAIPASTQNVLNVKYNFGFKEVIHILRVAFGFALLGVIVAGIFFENTEALYEVRSIGAILGFFVAGLFLLPDSK